MCDIKRLAIFALISSSDTHLVRLEQHYLTSLTGNSMALGFPVHITVKGRFLANQNAVEKVISDAGLSIGSNIPTPICVQLSEPKYIAPQLSWLEVLPSSEGFSQLTFLHQLFEQRIKEFVVEDEVPEAHKNSGFCPHITLGWGVTPQTWQEYSTNRKHILEQTQISHIALACYPYNWPINESVDLATIPV
ncbi:MAG: hypothetical protein QNJ46_19855 [Leptolyngbyaceae cyanobacterium MO_188.B28]|nr:hypothetical protein [Leptolyngbyaceae cyanobacterium MO_188.B28]